MSKLIPTIVVMMFLMLATWSLITITNENNAINASEVYDALGRKIAIDRGIKRVVSLSPSLTEIMFELGLDHLLIGVDQQSLEKTPYLNASKRLRERNITEVGGYWWPSVNLEKILILSPDLVLADKGAHLPLKEFFESFHITAVYFNGGGATTVEEVYQDILLIGKIFDKQAEAEKLIGRIDQEFQRYRNEGFKHGNVSVLIVVSIDQAIWVAGPETFIGDVLSKVGVKNACDRGNWVGASIEMIAQWNPTVIIVASDHITPDAISASGLEKLNSTIIMIREQSTLNMFVRPSTSIAYLPSALISLLEHVLGQRNSSVTASHLPVVGQVSDSLNYNNLHGNAKELRYSSSVTHVLFSM